MLEMRDEDEREPILILLKNVVPTIPKRESKLQELIEDLHLMGCKRLLAGGHHPEGNSI